MSPTETLPDVDPEVEQLTDLFLEQLRHSQGVRSIYERAETLAAFTTFVRVKKAPRAIAERIRDRVLREITLSEPMPA